METAACAIPLWSNATRSPSENATVVPFETRSQFSDDASHAAPEPFHVKSRGSDVFVTTSAQVCVHECPALSVTVKSNRARPVKFSVGVKVATFPATLTVPPTALLVVKVGDVEKPLVNFAIFTAMLVGEPVMFFATVPCGMLL